MTMHERPADPYGDLRQRLREFCADFGNPYFREKARIGEYPTEFVDAVRSRFQVHAGAAPVRRPRANSARPTTPHAVSSASDRRA